LRAGRRTDAGLLTVSMRSKNPEPGLSILLLPRSGTRRSGGVSLGIEKEQSRAAEIEIKPKETEHEYKRRSSQKSDNERKRTTKKVGHY
jgi:hypothetical protein